jgi:alpha-mannosidase
VHDDSQLVLGRILRFTRERLVPAVHRDHLPFDVKAWVAPGEPVPFADAVRQEFTPFAIGAPWGRPWGTVWFHVTGTVPADWTAPTTRPELAVDLGFSGSQPGFQAEATAYRPDGAIISAIEPRRRHVPLGAAGSAVDLYFEAAANPRSSARGRSRPPRSATSPPPVISRSTGSSRCTPPCSMSRCGSCGRTSGR